MRRVDDFDLTLLPVPPRPNGEDWPKGRSWTDSELLELREEQLKELIAVALLGLPFAMIGITELAQRPLLQKRRKRKEEKAE